MQQGPNLLFVLLFVDDLLITNSSSSSKEYIHAKYEMKDLGPICEYLGVDFLTSSAGILLHQTPYTHTIV